MSGPMPCEVRHNHESSSNSINPSCTRFRNTNHVFWTGYFSTPVRSLNTPQWVIILVLLGTDRGTFVMIVGAFVTWAIYTQRQLLLWSSLITTDWSQQELSLSKTAQVTEAPSITRVLVCYRSNALRSLFLVHSWSCSWSWSCSCSCS